MSEKKEFVEEYGDFNNFELREPEEEQNQFKAENKLKKDKIYNINLEKPSHKSSTENEFEKSKDTSLEYKTNDDRFEEYKAHKRNRSFREKIWDNSKNISDNLWSFTKFIIMLCI